MTDIGTGSRIQAGLAFVRRNAAATALELAVNFAAPFLIYTLLKPRFGDLDALMASSAPPIAWSLVEFARHRKVDALSIIVLVGIALSLVAFVGGGGVRFLQLRERLVTGLVGLIFLGSVAIGRPLIYYLASATISRTSAEKAAQFKSLRQEPAFKRTMLVMTLSWGVGLVADCAICGALVFMVSIKAYMLINPIIGYGLLGLMTAWTYWYARRRLTPAMLAAEQAAKAGHS